METLLAHLFGDYIIQNNWMATKKTENSLEGYLACLIHVILYTIPFLLITTNPLHISIIFLTHFFIDKFRLAIYWIKFWNWNWEDGNFGFPASTPFALSIWLMIIIDNTFHLLINYLTITLL